MRHSCPPEDPQGMLLFPRCPRGDPGQQSPSCCFLHSVSLGQLGASLLGSLTVKGLGRGEQTQRVVSGRSSKGSTMSDGLRPLQKRSSTGLCDLL